MPADTPADVQIFPSWTTRSSTTLTSSDLRRSREFTSCCPLSGQKTGSMEEERPSADGEYGLNFFACSDMKLGVLSSTSLRVPGRRAPGGRQVAGTGRRIGELLKGPATLSDHRTRQLSAASPERQRPCSTCPPSPTSYKIQLFSIREDKNAKVHVPVLLSLYSQQSPAGGIGSDDWSGAIPPS